MGVFKVRADSFEWIGGAMDDPKDLCLHGHVTVQFGDTVLEDQGTVSGVGNTHAVLRECCTEDPLQSVHRSAFTMDSA